MSNLNDSKKEKAGNGADEKKEKLNNQNASNLQNQNNNNNATNNELGENEAGNVGDEKKEKREKPVIVTTVVETPPEYFGAKGGCDFADCHCPAFYGTSGSCSKCGHGNLYHRIKLWKAEYELLNSQHSSHRAALIIQHKIYYQQQLKVQEAVRNKTFNKNHLDQDIHADSFDKKENEEEDEDDENNQNQNNDNNNEASTNNNNNESNTAKPLNVEVVNIYPCSVNDCECKKFEQPYNLNNNSNFYFNENNIGSIPNSPAPFSPTNNNNNNNNNQSLGLNLNSSNNNNNNNNNNGITINVSDPLSPSNNVTLVLGTNANNNSSYKMPKICRKCKHAEMYHIKMKKEKRIGVGGKGKGLSFSPKGKKPSGSTLNSPKLNSSGMRSPVSLGSGRSSGGSASASGRANGSASQKKSSSSSSKSTPKVNK